MKKNILLLTFLVTTLLSCAQQLTNQQIEEITDSIPKLIKENYVFKQKGELIAKEFQNLVTSNKYLNYKNPDSLALVISNDLKKISDDGHLYVKTKQDKLNDTNLKSWEELEKEREIKQNYGFQSVQILEDNTGYLKIIEFMHPKRSMQTAVAAMKFVENTDKLIIDIRGNGGGYPGIMLYILNHYFDGSPKLLSTTYSSDKELTPFTTYTSDLVYGKLRTEQPLYILIDSKTASAAEFFAYTAQVFDKAILIGEKSAGAAHMNGLYNLPHNLRISVSILAPINPKTNSNWESKGVNPDISTKRDISISEVLELTKEKK